MTKITKIEVTDFRGFEGLRTFDFGDAELIIFLGMNGFGKTSIFDAVEWCLTGHISRYERYLETGRKQDFSKEKEVLRNKYAANPNTLVKVHLSDSSKFGRRVTVKDGESDYGTGSIIDGFEFGLKTLSNKNIDADFIHHYFSATHILSQETIHDFVSSKKPEERYRALSVNFGTSLYDPFEENSQSLANALKHQEDNLKIRIKEQEKRLNDLKAQLKTEAKHIIAQVKEANQIVKTLFSHAPNIKLNEYILDEGEIKKGSNRDDVQRLISLNRISLDDFQKRLSILNSLSNDHRTWIEQNKELSKLDKQVTDHKQLLIKLKNLQTSLLAARNEQSLSEAMLQKETTDIYLAQSIWQLLPSYLQDRDKIHALNHELEVRHTSSKENQNKLGSITEILLLSEQELKSTDEQIREVTSISKIIELPETTATTQAITKLKTDAEKFLETTTDLRQKTVTLRQFEVLVDLEFGSLNDRSINELVNNYPTINRDTLLQSVSLNKNIITNANRIKELEQKKQHLEKEFQLQKKTLTSSHALLEDALKLIPTGIPETSCPVCEVVHETSHLQEIIKSKLAKAQSTTIDKIKADLLQCELEAETKKNEQKLSQEKLGLVKVTLQETLRSLSVLLQKEIESADSSYQNIRNEIKRLEEERDILFSRISSALKQDLKDLESALPIISGISQILEERRGVLERKIEELKKQQIELLKEIELHLQNTKIAQERLATLHSADHEKVNTFLVSNAIQIGEHSINQLNNYIEQKKTLCAQLTERISALKEHKDKIEIDLNGLHQDKTEDKIENEVVNLSSKINEIGRFLSDYKDRCVSSGIDIGNISIPTLKKAELDTTNQLEIHSKSIELLSILHEKVKEFDTYSKENLMRKKIKTVDIESLQLEQQMERIRKAKASIDELKKKFPKSLGDYIKQNLDVELFNQIYHSLNPHRRFKMIDFQVTVLHNKIGINFNATHSKVNARPEFLFSSAQLNTFGVSMFLSMALRQNWLNLDTILLDDPIQNLDDINVLSLIDLIRGLLDLKTGKQVIMSTHDERFYNLVKRKFSDYKIKAFKFESYGRVTPDAHQAA